MAKTTPTDELPAELPAAAPGAFPSTEPGEIVTDLELETTTLAELDGVLPSSRLAYAFHRPDMGTMRRLGQLQADKGLTRRPGQMVAYHLAAALSELGGETMGPVARDSKGAARVSALPVGDVLTLLVAWTHRQHTRKGVALGGAGCGACGAEWESIRVQLGELEVSAVPEGYAGTPTARVGLWEGFTVHGKDVLAVLVQPPTWGESLGGLSAEGWKNPTAIRAATIQGAIRACDAFPRLGRLGVEALDTLMPDDLELLDQALERITASVSLELSITCPACGAENATALDWKNLGFSGGPARA